MSHRLARWLLPCLLLGTFSHASVFGQQADKTTDADKLRQVLEKNITLDFVGQSLGDTLGHFRDKTGVTVNLDQLALAQMGMILDDNGGQFAIKASSEKASRVLRRFLQKHQMTYILHEGAILVTTEEMAIHRQMRQRVSVDLDGVPFNKAVRELAKAHGVNLVIDPTVTGQATPIQLQLEDTGLETTLRVVAELANLKAVRMGSVIFVTSDEKARKIREEERHQVEPPAIQYATPGFGGLFGGNLKVAPPPLFQVPGNPPVIAPPPPAVQPPVNDPAPPQRN
jgi:hypothetical protein